MAAFVDIKNLIFDIKNTRRSIIYTSCGNITVSCRLDKDDATADNSLQTRVSRCSL